MNINLQAIKEELFGGWKPFEVFWIIIFLGAQIFVYVQEPDSILGMISGISGILCVVFAGKGKISNYLFGLIFAYSYLYIALDNRFYGEMTTTLYVYIPAQFIGYFLWNANMQKSAEGKSTIVKTKKLTAKGWFALIVNGLVGSWFLMFILQVTGGNSVGLDSVTTALVIAAQLLMILRYSEQWLLWIVINILSIWLWVETPSMYLMYGAYLLNSVYGYYNWLKLAK